MKSIDQHTHTYIHNDAYRFIITPTEDKEIKRGKRGHETNTQNIEERARKKEKTEKERLKKKKIGIFVIN